ncbi:MAG: hypothetical protein IOD12_03700 [Silvanigrellales bacterium]|jgi:hypothetical protein|nr:hypothetical protein [Silvanigrellales bacterium]
MRTTRLMKHSVSVFSLSMPLFCSTARADPLSGIPSRQGPFRPPERLGLVAVPGDGPRNVIPTGLLLDEGNQRRAYAYGNDGRDGIIHALDLCSGRLLWKARMTSIPTSSPRMSLFPRGNALVYVDVDGVAIVDTHAGAVLARKRYRPAPPDTTAIDHRGSRLYVFLSESVDVLDLFSLTPTATLSYGMPGFEKVVGAGVRKNGTLVALSRERGLLSWEPDASATPKVAPLAALEFDATESAVLQGDRYLATTSAFDPVLSLVDVEETTVAQTYFSSGFRDDGFVLSDDLATAYAFFYDRVSVWETRTGRLLANVAVTGRDGERIQPRALAALPGSSVFFVGTREGIAVYGDAGDWRKACASP